MQQETRIEIPLEDSFTRAARSRWLILVSVLAFLAWAVSIFLAGEDKALLGTPLSKDHDYLKDDCHACHMPGRSVPNSLCASEECHLPTFKENLHELLDTRCHTCHPEHWPGEPIEKRMTEEECKECHDVIWAEKGRPAQSMVRKDIFSCRTHRVYECRTCHVTGEDTINVPREKLFKMDTCNICHEETQCMLCHSYHDKKAPPDPAVEDSDTVLREQLDALSPGQD